MRVGLALVALALAVSLNGLAQSPSGRISGTVVDPSGAPVPGAAVRALHLETGLDRETRSDVRGDYVFPILPVGEYELRASARDLQGVPRRLRLEVGRALEVSLRLELATARFSAVTVDSTPVVDGESAAVGFSIGRAELADLPLNRREFLQLALLSGGALPAAPGSELARQNESGLHLFGAREASNNFLLDGVDNNDLYINRLVVSPPLDAVREFRLHAANYPAEFGRSGGAQVNVVSRSGTNEWRGSLYEYLRNESLDARNYFAPADQAIPKLRRRQFGVSAGGPLDRDRSFFFGGYEGTRLREGSARAARVPTPAELAGDLSGAPGPVVDPFSGEPFPQNRIPADRLSPIAQRLAGFWPAPNRPDPTQNLAAAPEGDALINQLYGRIDHYLTPHDALFGRLNFSHDRALDPFGDNDTNVPGFGSFVLNRGWNAAVAETHVFSAAAVADIRLGFNRLRREVLPENAAFSASAIGLPAPADARLQGLPAIVVPGYDGLGDDTALPILRRDDTLHAAGALAVVSGRHTFKFGGEYRRFAGDGLQALFARGQFNFLGALSGDPLGDFLLGLPTFAIRTEVDNPFELRTWSAHGFAQDAWRLDRRLTLHVGARYEYNRPAVDAQDRFTVFDLERLELVPAAESRYGRAGYRNDFSNLAPRFGLSYSPAAGLVVRGGYGLFYDVAILEANSGLYFNPPYFDLRTYFPGPQGLLTLEDPFPSGAGFAPPPSVNALDPNFRTGYAQHWNAGVEKELPARLVLRASYVGSKGVKLLRRRDLNQPPPGPGDIEERRPIPGFGNVVLFESAAASTYHAGVLTLERRLADTLRFSASYTWSRSIDDASAFLDSDGDQGFPQNSRNFAAERGLSSFHQAHRLVFHGAFESPLRNPLLRDWRLLGIAVAGSGRPFTPALSFDNSNTGNSGSIFGQDRPDLVGDPTRGDSTPERWFDPTAFAIPAPYTFGNAGRNTLIGPGVATLDLAAVRAFPVGERVRVDLRVEAFNILNRANFDLPRRFADQPTFGRVASAGPPRQLQLGLRVSF